MSFQLGKLGDICNFVRGPFGGALKKEYFVESGIAVYEQQHAIYRQFSNVRYYIDDKKFKELKRFELNSGDLIMSCSGTMGKVAKVPFGIKKGIINQALLKLTPSDKIDLDFLIYWMESDSFQSQLNGHTRGAAIQNVASVKVLKELEIPLPSLAEQQKIVAILDAADSLRQKDQQLVDLYTALSQSLFLDMFGDPVTNPMGWDKVELGTLAKISSGSTPSRDSPENYHGNVPWVKTGEVNGTNINRTSECISVKALENSSCKLYPSGSLIIAMYGQGKTRGQVGRLNIEAATNQACAVIPPSSKMNYDFLFSLLKLSYEDLRSLGRGGNQPNLNSGLIKQYSVISPLIALQNQFASRIKLIEVQKQQAQLSLEKSQDLFNSLLQRAFTGELTSKMAA